MISSKSTSPRGSEAEALDNHFEVIGSILAASMIFFMILALFHPLKPVMLYNMSSAGSLPAK
jgi:hypothetical protein